MASTDPRRYAAARKKVLDGFSGGMIIIGSDTPLLSPVLLNVSIELVRSGRVVVGPNPYGGYYLLGVPQGAVSLAPEDIPTTSNETDALLEMYADFNPQTLEAISDINTVEDLSDLKSYCRSESSENKFQPIRTLKILNAIT